MARVAVVLASLAMGLLSCSGDDAGSEQAATTSSFGLPAESAGPSCEPADPVDLVVMMEPYASDPEIDAVGAFLANELPDSDGVEFFDEQAAYEEFSELFEDDPDFVESIDPEVLPTSFLVSTTAETTMSVGPTIEDLAGVREIVVGGCEDLNQELAQYGLGCGPDDTAMAVFMQPEATDAQIEAVGSQLTAGVANADRVEYVDQQAAYREFTEAFPDDPVFVESIDPEMLPTSFRVWTDPETAASLGPTVEDAPGLREVLIPDC